MSSDHSHSESQIVKLMLGGFVVFTVVTLVALHLAFGPRWYRGYQPVQPIPFSHELHSGTYDIPCLYCHGSAEYAAHSAVPGLETCMTCHSQVAKESPWIQEMTKHWEEEVPIPWVKVHVLPDFVHFNHRAHVAAGVECETCHGPVEEMEVVYQWADLSMDWCMNCHRNDDYLQPHRVQFAEEMRALLGIEPRPQWAELIGQKEIHNASVNCSTCHY